MTKLALALATAALAFAVTPASAYQHRQHHQHHRVHVQQHHVQHHHVHRHVTYHAPRYVPTYHTPVYAKPVVVYTEAPRNCFWAVEKHGYEVRKIWVCKTVEVKKPTVKVVEVQPAPTIVTPQTEAPAQAPDAEQVVPQK